MLPSWRMLRDRMRRLFSGPISALIWSALRTDLFSGLLMVVLLSLSLLLLVTLRYGLVMGRCHYPPLSHIWGTKSIGLPVIGGPENGF